MEIEPGGQILPINGSRDRPKSGLVQLVGQWLALLVMGVIVAVCVAGVVIGEWCFWRFERKRG